MPTRRPSPGRARARRSSPRRATGRGARQNAVTASRSNGLPSVWAIIDGARPARDGGLELRRRRCCRSGSVDVDEHRHEPVLDDRVDGRREAGRDGDHLVAGAQPPVAAGAASQRRSASEVRRRAGVDQQRVALAGARGRARARTPRVSGPAVSQKSRLVRDELDDLLRRRTRGRTRDRGRGRIEGARRVALARRTRRRARGSGRRSTCTMARPSARRDADLSAATAAHRVIDAPFRTHSVHGR